MVSFGGKNFSRRLSPARPLGNAAKERLRDLTRPVGTEDTMPVEYPAPRFAVSLREAAGVCAALLLFLGLWFVIQRPWESAQSAPDLSAFTEYDYAQSSSTGQPGALYTPAPPGQVTARASMQSGAPVPPSSEVVVAVVGAVQQPGLVTVAPGARVADALSVAQTAPEARVDAVNLAQKLQDGQQIIVPGAPQDTGQHLFEGAEQHSSSALGSESGAESAGAGGSVVTPLVSINSASAAELEQLPGVGAKTAAAIIEYRNTHGPFTDVAQLQEVKGIGPAKLEAIRGAVSV